LELDGVHLSPSGRQVAVETSRGVALYRTATLAPLWFAPTWHSVYDLAWASDERMLASSDISSCVFLWDAATGEHVRTLCGHAHEAVRLDWSRPERLASGAGSLESRFGEVIIWGTDSSEPLHVLMGVWDSDNDMQWSPNGSELATWSYHGKAISVRAGESGRVLRKVETPENLLHVHWSPDGLMLASPTFYSKELIIWDSRTGASISTLACERTCWWVAWSPDATRVAAVMKVASRSDFEEGSTIAIWGVRTGERLQALPGHAFSFSPDGAAIVTALEDGMLIVWDSRSGEELLRLLEDDGVIASVGWSQDGATILASRPGLVTAWNARTGERVGSIDGSEIADWK
jgi:WD40 repeat protein